MIPGRDPNTSRNSASRASRCACWSTVTERLPSRTARAAAARTASSEAAALAVRDGSRSAAVDQQVQRLAREALFLLVFGSRPGIKSALLRRFGASIG